MNLETKLRDNLSKEQYLDVHVTEVTLFTKSMRFRMEPTSVPGLYGENMGAYTCAATTRFNGIAFNDRQINIIV